MFLVKLSCWYLHLSPFRLFIGRTQNLTLKARVIFFLSSPTPTKTTQTPQTSMENSIWLLVQTICSSPLIKSFIMHLHQSQVQQEIHFWDTLPRNTAPDEQINHVILAFIKRNTSIFSTYD